jgi:hypothetical protein
VNRAVLPVPAESEIVRYNKGFRRGSLLADTAQNGPFRTCALHFRYIESRRDFCSGPCLVKQAALLPFCEQSEACQAVSGPRFPSEVARETAGTSGSGKVGTPSNGPKALGAERGSEAVASLIRRRAVSHDAGKAYVLAIDVTIQARHAERRRTFNAPRLR